MERVKITDFGLARAAQDAEITGTGVVAGTPQYMSPEQARGETVDHRSDLFSLGCVLYAMCTGRSPFRASTVVDAIRRVCEDTPRPIQEINDEIPDWLVDIIDRLLAKNREDRFQSASDVAELLGGHLAHLQRPAEVPRPAAIPAPVKKPEARTAARRRIRWGVATAVLLLLGLFVMTEATGVTKVAEFVGTVLHIVTPDGTLVVRIMEPNVKVTVNGEDGSITVTQPGESEIRLKPGKYSFQAFKNGQLVQSDWVTITRGDRQVVQVGGASLEEKAVSGTGPQPGNLEVRIPGQEIQVTVSGNGVSETIARAFQEESVSRDLQLAPGVSRAVPSGARDCGDRRWLEHRFMLR
jgi:hypothetical protein